MRDQPRHCRTTGVVRAGHLLQEDPERHQWREDPILPGDLDRLQCLRDGLLGENVGEREAALLEDLLAKDIDVTTKTSVSGGAHHWGSVPMTRVSNPSITTKE